jgi:hypothetical protein
MSTVTTDLRGKSTTQSYRTPVYYVDLTLRMVLICNRQFRWRKTLINKVKHQVLIKCLRCNSTIRFANAQFEVNEEGLDLVEEFYNEENQEVKAEQAQAEIATRTKVKLKPNQCEGFVQDMQKGLEGV